MDPPTSVLPEQLPLPLALVDVDSDGPPPVTRAADVWATLPPPLQAACRQTLIRVLQEVLHEAAHDRQTEAAPL